MLILYLSSPIESRLSAIIKGNNIRIRIIDKIRVYNSQDYWKFKGRKNN